MDVRAVIHPVSGKLTVFILDISRLALSAWESDALHSDLKMVDQITNLPDGKTESPEHLLVLDARNILYTEFFLRDGPKAGSYVATFDQEFGSLQQIFVGDPIGSELTYLPAVDKFADYRYKSKNSKALVRCWVNL